ncbi:hypothetical protein PVAP13_1NG376000 [Panicum virgatum]|uniref:Uncharacterized protein n=1 Tax=Panicum virgatum TaxID=38727 RepID=A0A8T0XBB8_PANVG|nr:hypothetical protein PVAP13_1NG376000 [Panicum virgatum]
MAEINKAPTQPTNFSPAAHLLKPAQEPTYRLPKLGRDPKRAATAASSRSLARYPARLEQRATAAAAPRRPLPCRFLPQQASARSCRCPPPRHSLEAEALPVEARAPCRSAGCRTSSAPGFFSWLLLLVLHIGADWILETVLCCRY